MPQAGHRRAARGVDILLAGRCRGSRRPGRSRRPDRDGRSGDEEYGSCARLAFLRRCNRPNSLTNLGYPVYNKYSIQRGERAAWPGASGSISAGRSPTWRWSTMPAGRSASPRCRPRPATSPRAWSARWKWRWAATRWRRAEVKLLSHATTVVTNAILGESGARAALITTRGFRDVLELRRSARADLYDLFQDAPSTLIPRRRRFEITERVGADGAVVTPLAEDEIDALIAALKAARVDAVAVSLLFSFLNPRARAPARRAAARGAARRADLSLVRRAARDQGVRAHQHHRGLRLCRADPRLLSRAAGRRRRTAARCRRCI